MPLGNLPFELCEMVFNHLGTRDILNCCLVSKRFYNFFNISSCLRRKVILIIDDSDKVIEILKSSRRFVRIKLNKLKNGDVLNILCHFSSFVEEMEIENCEMTQECELYFANLKCLTISCCSSNIILNIFKYPCENIKCLVLYRLYGPAFTHVVNFLKSNDTLEEINFYLDETNDIFSRDFSNEINFKLKSLFISYKPNYDLPSKTLCNIENFLQSQGDTLETISLINSASLMLLFRIWNNLKVIERLYFFSSNPIFDLDPTTKLNKNTKITDLELHALGPLSLQSDHLAVFLNASVNLKSLGVWNLKKDVIEYVARNLDKLRFISCATMENDCQSFYNDLKSKIGVNDKVQIRQYL